MNYSTTLDLRDIAEEWKGELEIDGFDAATPPAEAYEEYGILCDQLGCQATPDHLESYANNNEPVLILQSTFKEYAQEFAKDVGLMPRDLNWPLNCIDWEWAAKELAHDYTSVSYNGEEYYIGSC